MMLGLAPIAQTLAKIASPEKVEWIIDGPIVAKRLTEYNLRSVLDISDVEIKNAVLDEGVKVGHLTYLGDAHVGEHTNIGAGTVTCNYDGVMKHRTEIGARAFIGSDTMLVAPVRIGAGAMTASGSVITTDVPADALALGRAPQVNKPGLAARLMDRLRAIKAAKGKS